MFSTLEGYHDVDGGYYDSCERISGDVQYIEVFNISQRLLSICSFT